ncbi:MAG: class I SAM-dependent methyltransferase [Candidatus Diapherotrites archaeon]|nr:class I SAM-dependent methyltransferase [Candidatus Diapherotrites archaeon]
MRTILNSNQWAEVAKELENEHLKLASYDTTLIPLLDKGKGLKVLDYGSGPGVLASALKKLGFQTKAFDIAPGMRSACAEKIGLENVYAFPDDLPNNSFDYVVCNLVLCINLDEEVENIIQNINRTLKSDGDAFIGFCNPHIFSVPESRLDLRGQTGFDYATNHIYKKIKKEGLYEILELHRPVEWYAKKFSQAGLKIAETIFTPEYELNGKKINDFVIFRVKKGGN